MYLLDTNIVIFYFKGHPEVGKKFKSIGFDNCYISEITLAELKYGAEKSINREKHTKLIEEFIGQIQVLPILTTLDIYASEKTRLERIGNRIDDFDLLIGATAIFNNLILVTNNISHLGRMANIQIEDWTKS